MGSTVEMERREGPALFRFKTGDELEGVLMLREHIIIQEKPVMRYMVKTLAGDHFVFLGTADIITKLRAGDEGHLIHVKCIGEDVTVRRGDNNMKVFEVSVSREPYRGGGSPAPAGAPPSDDRVNPEITDDDIPF